METIQPDFNSPSYLPKAANLSPVKIYKKNPVSRLASALAMRLPFQDANKMALMINTVLASKQICIKDIPLSDEDLHDYLLMAFEERILIPVRTRGPGCRSWDRVLRFAPEEKLFMPRVARIFFIIAKDTGRLRAEDAVMQVLAHLPAQFINETVSLLKRMRNQSCMVLERTLKSFAEAVGLTTALEDVIDQCIIAGIINPCSRGTASDVQEWYEFHPCLYWDAGFK